jgi:hypothetical protein
MLYKIIFIFAEIDSTVVIQKMCASSKGKQIYVWNSKNSSILRIHGSHCAVGTAAKIHCPSAIRHSPYAMFYSNPPTLTYRPFLLQKQYRQHRLSQSLLLHLTTAKRPGYRQAVPYVYDKIGHYVRYPIDLYRHEPRPAYPQKKCPVVYTMVHVGDQRTIRGHLWFPDRLSGHVDGRLVRSHSWRNSWYYIILCSARAKGYRTQCKCRSVNKIIAGVTVHCIPGIVMYSDRLLHASAIILLTRPTFSYNKLLYYRMLRHYL